MRDRRAAGEDAGPRGARGLVSARALQLISDAARVGEAKFLRALEAALEAGLRRVQVREPSWGPERFEAFALRVAEVARRGAREGVLVIVSRRAELVGRLGLGGVHVGGAPPAAVSAARSAVPPGALVGYSAHSVEEIEEAARRGADYATYSPIFGAISKRHALPPLGLERLREACARSPIPVYALGGVLPEHAAEIRRAGAAGAAMIGGILDAPDPAAAVRRFFDLWESAAPEGA